MTNNTQQASECPCGSGMRFDQCCGVEGRTALNADVMLRLGPEGSILAGIATSQLNNALESLESNPDLFLARVRFLENRAWFVKMSHRWYQESVFLDPERIKGTYVIETALAWLQTVSDRIPWQDTGCIFHTAFCGSTLMAQALEAMFDCLPLREPEAMCNVVYYLQNPEVKEEDKKAWLSRTMHLFSRRYQPQQGVVIKANDFANPLICDLVRWDHHIPVLFMYTPLHEFVAGCMKADIRREWILNRYQNIKHRLVTIPGMAQAPEPEATAYGEMAALYWCYNISFLHQALKINPDPIRTLDFNRMLEQPLEAILACGRWMELQMQPDINVDAEIDRLFARYSKDSHYTYSPQQRAADIDKALSENQSHLDAAILLAREMLGDDYPDQGLPASLI